MKMKTLIMAIMGVVLSVTLSGCMYVTDVSGLQQYLQDTGKAELLAVKIKANNPDATSQAYKNAETIFNRAKTAANEYNVTLTNYVQMKKELVVGAKEYGDTDAGKTIAAFLALDPTVATTSPDPVMAATIATYDGAMIDLMKKQNGKSNDAAIKIITGEFSKLEWTTFEQTTPEWLNGKYKTSN